MADGLMNTADGMAYFFKDHTTNSSFQQHIVRALYDGSTNSERLSFP